MHNKVVFKTAQVLQTLGMPALRFNFRGVGHSTGTYDEGRGEMDDVRYALEFLSHRYPGLPVILAGFSFGAWVGLRAGCQDDRVQSMIGLGTPAKMFGTDYLEDCHKPKLFIHGTQDELAPFDLTHLWFERVPAPKAMIPVEGADHFFQNRLEDVQAMIVSFVQDIINPPSTSASTASAPRTTGTSIPTPPRPRPNTNPHPNPEPRRNLKATRLSKM